PAAARVLRLRRAVPRRGAGRLPGRGRRRRAGRHHRPRPGDAGGDPHLQWQRRADAARISGVRRAVPRRGVRRLPVTALTRRGRSLDATLPEQTVATGANRRRADRVIWAGLGRLPRRGETPTMIVEFVSRGRRDRVRDYEEKRDEYIAIGVREYWVIDRFAA